ncbi:flagellar protein FlaG [Caminibacter mediatlanticus TB-2]|uniref:Flagellar protein FlaG n=1 Tax=Caminibacter mediatlanticus TB-2 TaxID=391592 RepID=A0ABX5VAD2_9BACT|nr:flagellar protein FlaG [Caminibacter mediatlanticus]QCT95146.1 flagellar protein FlaG [Caminibacter mediatlanticus TB-2]
MDIFSNVNMITRKYDNQITQNNNLKTQMKEVEKVNEIIKDKSKEEIKQELQKIVDELNKVMSPLNENLKFQFNNKVDELVVKVVDIKNDKVIREFPPKEALRLMEKMRELVGILFDEKG